MKSSYTKVESLASKVFRRKEARETNLQIAESDGLNMKQIKQLVIQQNRKLRLIEAGCFHSIRPQNTG